MAPVAPARIAPPAVAPPAQSPTAPALVLVHVAGAVRSPGLYELQAGARVADAVEAARGPRRSADLDALNLAEIVVDGTRVLVPRRGAIPPAPPPVLGAEAAAPVVDLNAATQAELETIPGIGPVRAAAIIAHRAEIGRFERVEQLLDVDGIGPATLESVRPYVTV